MQLSLFPDLAHPPRSDTTKPKRRIYTMQDFRQTRDQYTHGWIKGPEMAQRLGVPYPSFRKFVIRNPSLKKRSQND